MIVTNTGSTGLNNFVIGSTKLNYPEIINNDKILLNDIIEELRDKNKTLESRIDYLEKEIENIKLDFLIKLDRLINDK